MKYSVKQKGDKLVLGNNSKLLTIDLEGNLIEQEVFCAFADFTFNPEKNKYISFDFESPMEIDSIADLQKWCIEQELK